jgi:alkylhydroperoxidase family enzyme
VLPERYKLAVAFADVVIGHHPREVPAALRSALLAELTPAGVVELALTVAVAQGFSKAAIAWGPAPELPLIELPTPSPER